MLILIKFVLSVRTKEKIERVHVSLREEKYCTIEGKSNNMGHLSMSGVEGGG